MAIDPFGTVSGGCSLASWKFLNPKGGTWSAVPDPIGGVESGNCVAQLTNAASSPVAQPASRPIDLAPGFYSMRCNVASKGNNSAQLSIQYTHAGSGAAPTSVKLEFGTNPNDPSGHTSSSLRTVATGGSATDSLCINLVNPLATAVTNPNDCHANVWAPTMGLLVKAINANPNYHATALGNFVNAPATSLDPSQSGQEIMNRPYSVGGGNQFGGFGCSVGGRNTAFRTNLLFGNRPDWMKPASHWNLGEVPPGASNLIYRLLVYGRPSGTSYWGLGKGTGLFRLKDPDANLMVRFPNFLHTYVDTLAGGADLKVDYRSVTGAACSGTPDCSSGQCEMELLKGDSIVAHRCVTPRTKWQTVSGFDFPRKADGDYTVRLAGIKSLTPSATISKLANIPVAWNGYFDANNWLHKRIPGSFSHANSASDAQDFSGPLLALGFYDTQAAHLDLAGNECVLNGVAGTPIGISSISESGTTVTVATTAPHDLSSGGKAAIAQLHSPPAAAAYDNSKIGPITVTDPTHFTFTALGQRTAERYQRRRRGQVLRGRPGLHRRRRPQLASRPLPQLFSCSGAAGSDRPTWQCTAGGAGRRHLENRPGQCGVFSVERRRPRGQRERAFSRQSEHRLLLHLPAAGQAGMRGQDRSTAQLDLERRRLLRTEQFDDESCRPTTLATSARRSCTTT